MFLVLTMVHMPIVNTQFALIKSALSENILSEQLSQIMPTFYL